jgi:peptidoglycan/xylan/chitin deacetylase (PgdA/CDA1 family)
MSPRQALLLSVAAAVAGYALLPDIVGRRLPSSVRRGPAGRDLVALTFDDGPDAELTPRVLDALAAAGATATFFVVGENVRRHPELVRRAVALGHALGVHTDHHRHAFTLGPAAMRAEMERGLEAVVEATGLRPLWFRPPWGSFNALTRAEARRLGLRTALWSCDAWDWVPGATPEAILQRVTRGLEDGAIIDLHDGGRTRPGCRAMAAALPDILRAAGQRGLRPVHLGALWDLPAMQA